MTAARQDILAPIRARGWRCEPCQTYDARFMKPGHQAHCCTVVSDGCNATHVPLTVGGVHAFLEARP